MPVALISDIQSGNTEAQAGLAFYNMAFWLTTGVSPHYQQPFHTA